MLRDGPSSIALFHLQQLRSNIREMEKLCLKVHKDDLVLLKRMIDPVKEAAATATAEFLQLHLESVEELKKQVNDEELLQPSLTRSTTVDGNICLTFDPTWHSQRELTYSGVMNRERPL